MKASTVTQIITTGYKNKPKLILPLKKTTFEPIGANVFAYF